ncbi:magnesium/cobalt transporter CorA [Aphanothece sacrum]|uniref:Magnesium transport protein CorA n=1 Tax=Aphanothece sacrum FPU1 TaxID=1920663 RepID=A0A401IBU7_APHSA|nr:magnesium/cobalt transporter CorA [Aphanothece sacrum]GBF78753.1 magnesium and cobalt transport protein CorA [Aphanothece sacrum FPU1]GBF82985.1 magnesium and cobalt transport protein CorA [Aphanothece sacrum FPU3]
MTQSPVRDSELLDQRDLEEEEEEEEEEDYFDYFYDEPGSEPGTLSIEPDAKPSRIVLIDYDADHAVRKVDVTPNALIPYLGTNTISWMDVQGLGSEKILKQVGDIFKLHPLLLEDVVNVPQRPKVEDYNEQLMIIVQMVRSASDDEGFESEQVGFVLGAKYLLTFQEEEIEDCFDIVRDRIRGNQGKVRQSGPDYLAYLLLDSIIDGYFPVLENYGDRIEMLEDQIVLHPDNSNLEEIYSIRRELLSLRRSIWPLRNVTDILVRGRSPLISPDNQIYFRDCYDHVIQLLDIVETYRELSSSLMDVYLSSMSNKMNEVMQLLTVISTIFIPLTFIAGLYGMNFKYMPELEGRWSYFIALGGMAAIAGGLIFFFWRRGWFKPFYAVKKD